MNKIVKAHVSIGNVGIRLLLINICWLLGVLLGLVIFGFTPSTVAAERIIYTDTEKIEKIINRQIPRLFFQYYRREFITTNLLMLPLNFALSLVIIDFLILRSNSFTIMDSSIQTLLIGIFLLLIVYWLFVAFVASNSDATKKSIYVKSLVIMFGRIGKLIGVLLFLFGMVVLYYSFPGVLVVFGISPILYFISIYMSDVIKQLTISI